MLRNRDKLGANPRLGQVYRTWDRMADDVKVAYLESAGEVLKDL